MPAALKASLIIAIIALALALFSIVHVLTNKPVTCHWQVPLKVNYQICSDGKVREFNP